MAMDQELSLSGYQHDKQRARELQIQLAELAERDIVLAPES